MGAAYELEQSDRLYLGAVTVTTVLAQRDGEWFLAAFAPHIHGCNLSTNQKPRLQAEKFHLWRNAVFVQSHAPVEGVTFYPEIYYHGCRVWPQWWHSECEELILRCLAMPSTFDDLDSDYFRTIAKKIGAIYPGDVLRADGWEQIARGEYIKYIHVDDLEKIEGPPPEGPF